MTATALVVIDMTVVALGLPEIQRDLGGGPAATRWVLVAYLITMGAVTQAVGSLSDRIGRRRIYLGGIALFTLASLACALAPNAPFLDGARAVQGVGGAVLMVNALPLLSHQFDGDRRTMAITSWGTVATAAGLAAPVLGGVLIDLFDWRAAFLINVPVGVAALLLGLRTLPADPPRDGARPRVDWAGTGLLIGALAVGNHALLRGAEQGWGSPATLAQLAAAGVLLAAFLAVEPRVAAPTLDLALFRRPAFTGAALAVFMSRVLSIGGTVYFAQYFQNSLLLSPAHSGWLLAPAIAAQLAAGLVAGRLLAVARPGVVIAAGYAAKAVGAGWLALALTPTAGPWTLVPPLLVWGVGGGIAGAPVMAVAMNVTDRARAGMVAGTITSLASIGAGVGTAVLGAVYESRLGPDEAGAPSPAAVAEGAATVLACAGVLAAATAALALPLIGAAGHRAAEPAAEKA
ncbi:MFS transporter [Streptomyces hainanensis]|uniref:MFS transporter n=2 Tax=Streptomyces hainanensis TaxID=402648 RepID=A0A4R4TH50_9ACTN|nr:MFS transporter [Streptomyces hainanensis]